MPSFTLEQVRTQEFAREYLWDIEFPSFRAGWIPALDVELGMFSHNSQEFQLFTSTYKTPGTSAALEMQITFAELSKQEISNWLLKWYETDIMYKRGTSTYVGMLTKAVRPVIIQRLNPDRTPVSTTTYQVYPEGELRYHGSSDSAAQLITATFSIAGITQ